MHFVIRCTVEAVAIASVLSVGDVFINARGSKERKQKVSDAMQVFAEPEVSYTTTRKSQEVELSVAHVIVIRF